MTDADWANVCYYQSDSVLFIHKATNDMRAAASNISKNKEVSLYSLSSSVLIAWRKGLMRKWMTE
jgi:hypothetical protein